MTVLELVDELLYQNYRYNRILLQRVPRGFGANTRTLEERYQQDEAARREELREELEYDA